MGAAQQEIYIGQQKLLESMRSAVSADRIGHALIFSGPEGSGKSTLARWLTELLLCRDPAQAPCGRCPACKKVRSGNHPDVHVTGLASGARSLKVEDVEALQQAMANRAYEGGRRVFILESAHLLVPAAQNKLLKTLEEPPQGVTLMLLVNHTAPLLPTVISRCRHIRMQRLPTGEIERALRERWTVGADRAAHAARACDGWLGAAVTLAQDEEYWDLRQTALEMLEMTGEPGAALRILARGEGGKAPWPRIVELWQSLLRDAALQGADGGFTLNPDIKDRLRAVGERFSPDRIQAMWWACHQAQQRFAANVNALVVMDWLFTQWEGREEIGFGDRRPL